MSIVSRLSFLIECSEPGGAERVVLILAQGFKNRGAQVSVLTLQQGWLNDELRSVGIEPVLIPSERRLDVSLPFRIAAILRETNSQILHSHLLDSNFYGSIAAKLSGVPHVATDHGDVHLPKRKKLLRTKIKVAASLGGIFTGVSQFTCERLIELGAAPATTRLLYNPVVSPAKLNREERLGIRREFGAGEDEWVWIHVAMLRPVKDQATLLKGFAWSQQKSAALQRLVIVGDGEDRVALELLAAELEIASRVKFLGIRTDVSRLLPAADGFVLSSVSEALPMTVLEAGMAGLVVISSKVGGVPEIIRDRENGFLFSTRDVSGLSDRMAWVVEHRAESRELAKESGLEFERLYSMDVILDQYQALYNELIAARVTR